jgi:internalin A
MSQAQLASVCQRTSGLLREVSMDRSHEGPMLIQDLIPLTSCSRLTALDLSSQKEIEDFIPLSSLVGLKELRLGWAPIRTLDPLQLLTQLTFLDTCFTPVTCLEPLSSLLQLEVLNLSKCKQITSLVPLSSLSRLHDLRIFDCRGLPASALSPLSSCTALKQLDIRFCNFDLAPLASCHDLRRLYVYTPFQPDLDLTPLQGLMPRLVVKQGLYRKDFLDARSL